MTGEWRRICSGELYELYCPTNNICLIKSRRMRWVGHVAHMGNRRGVYRGLVGRYEGKTTCKT